MLAFPPAAAETPTQLAERRVALAWLRDLVGRLNQQAIAADLAAGATQHVTGHVCVAPAPRRDEAQSGARQR